MIGTRRPLKVDLNFNQGDWCGTDAVPSPGEELEAARAATERASVPSRAKTGQRAESRKSDRTGLSQWEGRVKLPGRLRWKLGIEICEEIIVELGKDCIILKKVSPNASIEDFSEITRKACTKRQANEIENSNNLPQKQILI